MDSMDSNGEPSRRRATKGGEDEGHKGHDPEHALLQTQLTKKFNIARARMQLGVASAFSSMTMEEMPPLLDLGSLTPVLEHAGSRLQALLETTDNPVGNMLAVFLRLFHELYGRAGELHAPDTEYHAYPDSWDVARCPHAKVGTTAEPGDEMLPRVFPHPKYLSHVLLRSTEDIQSFLSRMLVLLCSGQGLSQCPLLYGPLIGPLYGP
jgi:hypothetical protein